MVTQFVDIKTAAAKTKQAYSGQADIFDRMKRMFFMNPKELPRGKDKKVTISASPRNQLLGAVHLLTTADPIVEVPNRKQDDKDSNAMEVACSAMWDGSGRTNGEPVHTVLTLAGLLYGRSHASITSLAESQKAVAGKAAIYAARLTRISGRTPFLAKCLPTESCYPRFDDYGLSGHLFESNVDWQTVRSEFGNLADKAAGKTIHGDSDRVKLSKWWDLEYYAVWEGNSDKPIWFAPHEKPFIPISVILTNGSRELFSLVTEQLQPFLYGVDKSGMWNRENLTLTAMYTIIFGILTNPMFIHVTKNPEKEFRVDFSGGAGVLHLLPGEEFKQIAVEMNPYLSEGLRMADDSIVDSTIYRQARGQPLGSGTQPYSTVALLNQAGRLPLASPQKRLGWLCGEVMENMLSWYKLEGKSYSLGSGEKQIELDPAIIPEAPRLDVTLDIALPQDTLSLMNLANLAVASGLMSKERSRREFLKIGQSSAETVKIWSEQLSEEFFKLFMGAMMPTFQAQLAATLGKPNPANPANQGGPANPTPDQLAALQAMIQQGGVTPEIAAQLGGGRQGPQLPGQTPPGLPGGNTPGAI